MPASGVEGELRCGSGLVPRARSAECRGRAAPGRGWFSDSAYQASASRGTSASDLMYSIIPMICGSGSIGS